MRPSLEPMKEFFDLKSADVLMFRSWKKVRLESLRTESAGVAAVLTVQTGFSGGNCIAPRPPVGNNKTRRKHRPKAGRPAEAKPTPAPRPPATTTPREHRRL